MPSKSISFPIQARLRFSNEITEEDIIECEDIMEESQKNVVIEGDTGYRKKDPAN